MFGYQRKTFSALTGKWKVPFLFVAGFAILGSASTYGQSTSFYPLDNGTSPIDMNLRNGQNPVAYPTTRYQGFISRNQEAFAVSPPLQADSVRNQIDRDYRSMSPDSWENPQGGYDSRGSNPFSMEKREQRQPVSSKEWNSSPESNTNDFRAKIPEKNNPFQSTGHPIGQPNERGQGMSPTPSFPSDIRLPHSVQEKSLEQELLVEPNQDTSRTTENGLKENPNTNPPSGYPLYSNSETSNPRSPLYNNREVQNSPHVNMESLLFPLPGEQVQTTPEAKNYPVPNQPILPGLSQNQAEYPGSPNYRPDLGHRSPYGVQRDFGQDDYGQVFDFEKKKEEYPGLGEILKTGRYFGSASAFYVRPSFQANTAIFQTLSGSTDTFEFSYKLAPQFQFGFESKFGPGVMFDYFGYDDLSQLSTFTSNGIESGTTSAWMRGANIWSRLTADGAGETLSARHRMNLDVVGVSFFKEVKLKKARINGAFGFQYAHIIHELQASLTDSVGTQIGTLRARSDVRGYGPKFKLEYFRPVGHTKIEFLVSTSGSVLFGDQSQVISNSTGGNQSRLEANEFVLTFDYFTGAQYRVMRGENRYFFAKAGMNYQAWVHGGTAVLPQDDFGLRGFAVTAGFNR